MREMRTDELLGPLPDFAKKHAPKTIYVEGDMRLLQTPRVAIVGTRKPSDLGVKRTERIAKQLVQAGVTVVSGLALGVDTVAHQTALKLGGKTMAVLGGPVDEPYPASNRDLHARIAKEHLLVSQFAPGTPITRTNFPRRNRTMAFLSHTTIIVEAGASSGTVSQGWEALRLGRPLYLLQSLVDAKGLDWPAEMIAHGAEILTKPSDMESLLDQVPPALDAEELQHAAF